MIKKYSAYCVIVVEGRGCKNVKLSRNRPEQTQRVLRS